MTISERILESSFASLDWPTLKEHFIQSKFVDADAQALLPRIRRQTSFVIKRENAPHSSRIDTFLSNIQRYLQDNNHIAAATELSFVRRNLLAIGRCYQSILRAVARSPSAQASAATRVAAILVRAALTFHEIKTRTAAATALRTQLTPQTLRIEVAQGQTTPPDAIIGALTEIATMTALMEAHNNRWFDKTKIVVLPITSPPTQQDVDAAASIEILALEWRRWTEIEERWRYFGGELAIEDPVGAHTKTIVTGSSISDAERLDFFANQRLHERLIQTYLEMDLATNLHTKGSGIAETVMLPPKEYVSSEEAHCAVSMSEILGFSIANSGQRLCGLRLVEWLRGFSALRCLANDRYESDGVAGLIVIMAHDELVKVLTRVGLPKVSAIKFIELASLYMSSRDLFDQPMMRTEDGRLILFGPALIDIDATRTILSALSNRRETIKGKGKAFENDVLRLFVEEGLNATPLKFRHNGQDVEIDVLVEWGEYLFVFECKNYSLSANSIPAAYNFSIEQDAAVRQVRRQIDALALNAKLLMARTEIDLSTKTIVGCVVNSLTYSRPGESNGIYVSDASALKRFFQERYFHVNVIHSLEAATKLVHRNAMVSLWSGDRPTPKDLLAFLLDPLALKILNYHTSEEWRTFECGSDIEVTGPVLKRNDTTTESLSKLFGADAIRLEADIESVRSTVQDVRARLSARSASAPSRRPGAPV